MMCGVKRPSGRLLPLPFQFWHGTERFLMTSIPLFLADVVMVDTSDGKLVSVVLWLTIGLVAGFLANKLISKRGEGVLFDIALGLVGSLLGGLLVNLFGV